MQNPFMFPVDDYKRDLNLPGAYVNQSAQYLSIMTGDDLEKTTTFIKEKLSSGEVRIQDPKMLSLVQETPGNRIKHETTFLKYIGEVVRSGRIMSPSMTVYERPEVKQSLSATFVAEGIAGRKKAKHEMLLAGNMGNQVLKDIKNAEQNSKKIDINSISGMHGFPGNILWVKSGHPSLTSMCRSATSYSNSSTESLIGGSRHYYEVDVVINHILTVCTHTNWDVFLHGMRTYGLRAPTPQETMDCILWSTDLYSIPRSTMGSVADLVARLNDDQRAALVYSNDMYHLTKYNSDVVRKIFDDFCLVDFAPVEDPDKYINVLRRDNDLSALVNYMCADIVQDTNRDMVRENNPEGYKVIGGCAKYIMETVEKHSVFFNSFFALPYLPGSIADIRGIVRRVACTSDTDSTISTTQETVMWYTGSLEKSQKADRCWYLMTWIAIQRVGHVLAMFSTQMGVPKDKINMISMKNEWSYPGYSITNSTKHYFAHRSGQEGNVYSDYKPEIKGVGLRSSTIYYRVIKDAEKFMLYCVSQAIKGEQLSIHEVYGRVWYWEQEIKRSIKAGEPHFFKSVQIKSVYKNMETSPYQQYLLWNDVFGKRYGKIDNPPYEALRTKLTCDNKTKMQEWYDSIEDLEIRNSLQRFMQDRGRTHLTSIAIPVTAIQVHGVPDEILQVMDIRNIVYQTLASFYLVLGSLGLHQVDENNIRLIHDIYTPPQEWIDHFEETLVFTEN